MYTFAKIAALGAFVTSSIAQAITFSNTTFTGPATVGQIFSVFFSRGNGNPVSILFGNTTYSFQVVDSLIAPGQYDFRVAVPVNVVPGLYQMSLFQVGATPVFSPAFQLVIPPAMSSATTSAPMGTVAFPPMPSSSIAGSMAMGNTTVTAIYLPGGKNMTATGSMAYPSVTYIYYDEHCSCHHTSSVASSALPKPTSAMSTTVVTYSAAHCGCTTTVTAPCAPTVLLAAAAPASTSSSTATAQSSSSASSSTTQAPAPAAPAATSAVSTPAPAATTTTAPAPAKYTGGAKSIVAGRFGVAAFIAAWALM